MSRERLFAAFFFAVFAFLIYQLLLFLAPFFGPLVWAAILALTFYPLTTWLVRLFRGSRGIAAGVLVLAVVVVAILPALYLGSLLVREATSAYSHVQQMVADGEITRMVEAARASRPGQLLQRVTGPLRDRVDIDPASLLLGATSWISQQIVGHSGAVARNALVSLLNGSLMLVALYFFFRDGERIARSIRDLIPMERVHKEAIFQRLYDTLAAVVQSMVVGAVLQGVLGGIGYWLIGDLPFSTFLGFLTGFAAFFPMAGAVVVWGPAAIYLYATDHVARAVGMLLWGVLVISMVDNLIRPLLIGGRAQLPTFLLLFSILGGLSVYGFLGVFLAPVVVAALLSFVEIYRDLYTSPAILVVDSTSEVAR